jgi:hypothetical protein
VGRHFGSHLRGRTGLTSAPQYPIPNGERVYNNILIVHYNRELFKGSLMKGSSQKNSSFSSPLD